MSLHIIVFSLAGEFVRFPWLTVGPFTLTVCILSVQQSSAFRASVARARTRAAILLCWCSSIYLQICAERRSCAISSDQVRWCRRGMVTGGEGERGSGEGVRETTSRVWPSRPMCVIGSLIRSQWLKPERGLMPRRVYRRTASTWLE